jgi:hypothetical protein
MAAARQCVAVSSSWIAMAILMCDDTLSVAFKNGVCCNYPRSTKAHFQQMIAAPSKGRWLWHNLYKILPYRLIRLPCPAAGCGIATSCCGTLPTTLHATGDLGMGSVALVWDGSQYWAASGISLSCGQVIDMRLSCTGSDVGGMALQYNCDGAFWDNYGINLSSTCGPPLNLVYQASLNFFHCGGCGLQNHNVTVTR